MVAGMEPVATSTCNIVAYSAAMFLGAATRPTWGVVSTRTAPTVAGRAGIRCAAEPGLPNLVLTGRSPP